MQMNRSQRRAARRAAAGAPRPPKRWNKDKTAFTRTLDRIEPMGPEDWQQCSAEARLAWHHASNGIGTVHHLHQLTIAAMVCTVLAAQIDAAAQHLAEHGCAAVTAMQARFKRLGKVGADARALADVPPLLDLYDQQLQMCSPLQIFGALEETYRLAAQLDAERQAGGN